MNQCVKNAGWDSISSFRGEEMKHAARFMYVCVYNSGKVKNYFHRRATVKVSYKPAVPNIVDLWLCTSVGLYSAKEFKAKIHHWSAMNAPDLSGCWNRSASCQGQNKTAVFCFYSPHIWNLEVCSELFYSYSTLKSSKLKLKTFATALALNKKWDYYYYYYFLLHFILALWILLYISMLPCVVKHFKLPCCS